jgi:hypothetical protein
MFSPVFLLTGFYKIAFSTYSYFKFGLIAGLPVYTIYISTAIDFPLLQMFSISLIQNLTLWPSFLTIPVNQNFTVP